MIRWDEKNTYRNLKLICKHKAPCTALAKKLLTDQAAEIIRKFSNKIYRIDVLIDPWGGGGGGIQQENNM